VRVYGAVAAPDDAQPSPGAAWTAACRDGRLAFQRAPDGTAVFPPRLAQPGTGARLTWATSAGRGTVHAATVVRRRGEPAESLVLVDLDEGFRMMSAVVGVAPEEVRVGQRVRLAWRDGDPPVPVFEVQA
jgi:uncharacterized OB-fold protein